MYGQMKKDLYKVEEELSFAHEEFIWCAEVLDTTGRNRNDAENLRSMVLGLETVLFHVRETIKKRYED
jgi:hypothetical protein